MTNGHNIPELGPTGLRHFGLTTAGIVIVLFALLIPWVLNLNFPIWPWVTGGILAIWALLIPATLGPVYTLWMKLGLILSKITTPLILGLMYLTLIIPTGFILKLLGKDPLSRTLDEDKDSFRVVSEPLPIEQMEKPY